MRLDTILLYGYNHKLHLILFFKALAIEQRIHLNRIIMMHTVFFIICRFF